jgi:hypothetical protein
MTSSAKRDSIQDISSSDSIQLSTFPTDGILETPEQIRRFELLRLAFFVLKLRKLEQGAIGKQVAREEEREHGAKDVEMTVSAEVKSEQELHRSLLRHVIFQQVLTLIKLDAREQALQIIEACHR